MIETLKLLYASKEEQKRINKKRYLKLYRKNLPDAVKIARREASRIRSVVWRKNNPEKIKKHYLDKGLKWHREYHGKHKDKSRKSYKKWQSLNYERSLFLAKKTRQNNPEIKRKAQAKRYRNLQYRPLNTIFKDSNSHHLDTINIIYITQELHKSIWHRNNNEQQMKIINMKAWDYMEMNVL